MTVVEPLIIYPEVEIAQLYYHTVHGEMTSRYEGKYQNNKGIQASKIYKELRK